MQHQKVHQNTVLHLIFVTLTAAGLIQYIRVELQNPARSLLDVDSYGYKILASFVVYSLFFSTCIAAGKSQSLRVSRLCVWFALAEVSWLIAVLYIQLQPQLGESESYTRSVDVILFEYLSMLIASLINFLSSPLSFFYDWHDVIGVLLFEREEEKTGSTLTEWGFWIAVAALLAGIGKFVDDYHVRANQKTRIRNGLVKAYLWLDSNPAPNVAFTIMKVLNILRSNRGIVIGLWAISAYLLATSVFWFYRFHFTSEFKVGYFAYTLSWLELGSGDYRWPVLMVEILAASLCGCFFDYLLVVEISKLRVALIKSFLTCACTIYGCTIAVMVASNLIRQDFGYGANFVFAAAAFIPGVVATTTLILILLRGALVLARRVGMFVFDAASSPAVSPFTYFTSLLGVGILLMKIVQEIVK